MSIIFHGDVLTVLVPTFARLVDYIGPWLLEEKAAAALCQFASRVDLQAHIDAGAQPLQSVVERLPAPGGKQLAVIRLQGLLMKGQSSMGGTSTVQARRDVRQAAADPDIAGILLAVDSPGGSVAGTDDLAKDVRTARRTKPVWAHIDDLGASAAYWVASQADRITANSPTALIGSIGTLGVVQDTSAADTAAGVRTIVFRTGPLKGRGIDKVTDEQIAHAQGLVDSVQQTFDAAVQRGRGLTDKQLAAVRHGGEMTATEALAAQLIDSIQSLDKTIAEMMQAIKSGASGAAAKNHNFDPGTAASVGSLPMIRHTLPMIEET